MKLTRYPSLDRTNFVQDVLSRTALEQFLVHVRREWIHAGSLWSNHGELWAENGDALSRIYAGTGALNTSFTRSGKRTLGGLLSDATKSVSRAYINNFQDKGKQVAIDMFLVRLFTGLITYLRDEPNLLLCRRETLALSVLSQYSTQFTILFGRSWRTGTCLYPIRQKHF